MIDKDIEHKKINQIPATLITQQVYSSPLPPPEVLIKYNQINPEILEKIIEMSESQAIHRQELEKDFSKAQLKQIDCQVKHVKRRDLETNLGQIFAFIISIIAISGGIYTSLKGYQLGGGLISISGLSVLIPSFINGRKEKNEI